MADGSSISPDPTKIAATPNSIAPGIRAKGKEIAVENETLEIEKSRNGDFMRSSKPHFLKSVLSEEPGTDFSDSKLVFLAIHAVFLESGFVGFDSVSGLRADHFDILKEQSSLAFTTSISYTRPELLSINTDTESIVLKLNSLGHFVNVYASLASNPTDLHTLNIDKTRFVPPIGKFWFTFDRANEVDLDSTDPFAETLISEFWKIVKDGLVYPLMIDLCLKTGLAPPPCWARIPLELKYRVLELLGAKDTGRAACVCKELRELASDDELWKEKYTAVYGNRKRGGVESGSWKKRTAVICREDTKREKRKRKREASKENTSKRRKLHILTAIIEARSNGPRNNA